MTMNVPSLSVMTPIEKPAPNAETLLPRIEDRAELSANRKNRQRFEAGLRQILRDCGLGEVTLSDTVGGSMPVFGVNGDLVIKLFPHTRRPHFENELASLRRLAGKTPFAVPELKASGEFESWFYVLITRVPGVPLARIWPEVDDAKKAKLLANFGAAIAALHRIATATAEETATWRAFMARQVSNCVENHRGKKLPGELIKQIPDYIAPALPVIESSPVVFLHTELMSDHVLVDPDELTVTGLIDFEPSTMGAVEYDFTGVPIFITQGRPQLLRAFLQGYGYRWENPDFPSARLAMTYNLLHRYSNLNWFLDLLGERRPQNITRLEELEQFWWSA